MPRYICDTPCFHNGHRFRMGQIAVFADGEYPKDKEGKLTHFVLIDEPAPAVEAPPVVRDPVVRVNGKGSKGR